MEKIAIAGVLTAILLVQFQKEKPEYRIYLTLAGTCLILFLSTGRLEEVVDGIRQMEDYLALEPEYQRILLKVLGITYLAEFAAGICQDAGCQTLGQQIRIFARLSILAVSLPVLLGLLSMLQELLHTA